MKQDQSKHAYMYDADGDKETVQQISDAYFSGFVAHDDAQPLADADKQKKAGARNSGLQLSFVQRRLQISRCSTCDILWLL